MDSIDLAIVVVLVVGAIVAGILEFTTPALERPAQVALLTLGAFFEVAAFIPQLIENQNLKSQATDDIRPSFLILVTLSFYLRLPAERRLVVEAYRTGVNKYITTAQALSIFVPIIFYTTWQFQVAEYNSTEGTANNRKVVSRVSSILCVVVFVVAVFWVFSAIRIRSSVPTSLL